MFPAPISVGESGAAATGHHPRLSILAALILTLVGCSDAASAPATTAVMAIPTTTTTAVVADLAWSRSQDPVLRGSGHQLISAVADGGPGLIAVGIDSSGGDADGAVWVSADGTAWSRVGAPELEGPDAQGLADLAVGPQGIVAVGFDSAAGDIDAAAWYSVDGLTWERVNRDGFAHEGHEEVQAVLGTPFGFVAAGFEVIGREADAAVWTSPDGRSWSRLDDPALGGDGTQRITSLVVGPEGLVAGGTNFTLTRFGVYQLDARVWLSTDGTSWSAVDDPTFGGEGWQYITSIVSGPDGLVAPGGDLLGRPGEDNDAAVWTSPDGHTWTRVVDPDFDAERAQQISAVATGPGGLIAVGYDTGPAGTRAPAVWLSADGRIWSRVADPGLSQPGHSWMSGVAVGSRGPVAVGTDGSVNGGNPAIWLFGTAPATTA